MRKRKVLMATLAAILAVAMMGGCTAMTGGGERPEVEGGGEEGGSMLALDKTFNQVRKGVRLIMSYNAGTSAFIGTVENTTTATLQQVRVEVHLSNGVELGPTKPIDLTAGETQSVTLDAAGHRFTGWVPHAEVGPQTGGEHGPGGEGGGS